MKQKNDNLYDRKILMPRNSGKIRLAKKMQAAFLKKNPDATVVPIKNIGEK